MLVRKSTNSSSLSWLMIVKPFCLATFFAIVPLTGTSRGQDSFTLDGPNPRVTCIDTSNQQTWVLQPDQNGFYIIDDTNNQAVTVAIKPGARDSALVAANNNIGMGTSNPLGLLDLRDEVGTSSVVLNPGSTTTPSLAINEATDSASISIKTSGASRIAQIALLTPNGGHSFRSTSSGILSLRDDGVNRAVLNVYPSVLNSNLLTLRDGNIGIAKTNPTFPIHMKSGARCTVGGVWTNASSRELKQNIEALDGDQAAAVVSQLRPVTYQYKSEPSEDYVGFIAEDVPELLATNDRKSLAAMDVVAVLTKVVQDQQVEIARQAKEISELKALQDRQAELAKQVTRQETMLLQLSEQFASLSKHSAETKSDAQELVSTR